MDCRHLDRRRQCGDHRRQPAREAGRAAQGILGAGFLAGALASRDAGRPRPFPVQRDQRRPGRDLRRARLLHAADSSRTAVAERQPAGAELLRHYPAAQDPGAAGRFRHDQRSQVPAQRRRGERHDRQFQIFRQFRVQEAAEEDRAGTHHGVRRAAAGLSFDRNRRRTFLGRRHRLQHAARLCARCGNPERSPDLPDRPVLGARPAAGTRCWRPPSAKRTSAFPAAPG